MRVQEILGHSGPCWSRLLSPHHLFDDPVYAAGSLRHLNAVRTAHPQRPLIFGVVDDTDVPGTPDVARCADFEGLRTMCPDLIAAIASHDTWIDADMLERECLSQRPSRPEVMFCVPHRAAPTRVARNDGAIDSFVCTPDIFADAVSRQSDAGEHGSLCYHAVFAALDQAQAAHFRVVIDQPTVRATTPVCDSSVAVIIPHRGELWRLKACLSVSTLACRGARFVVGFDEVVTPSHVRFVEDFPDVAFYSVSPQHVGPYVIRQFLIDQSEAEFIAFQDSDDLACDARLDAQYETALGTGADMVGCHEIRIDEPAGLVEAIRYPLDVNAALGDVRAHVQLSPTTFVRRAVFHAESFSTRRRYASDREFMLRATFNYRLVNCDGFHYVRFRHAESLTLAPGTAAGSRFRNRFADIWARSAMVVRDGRESLAQSALRPRHLYREPYLFRDLRSGNTIAFAPRRNITRSAHKSDPLSAYRVSAEVGDDAL